MHGRGNVAPLEELEALRARVPGRSGIEHEPAADRRLGPQHDAIAARRHDRPAQAQLRVAADPRHARRDVRRPKVNSDRGRNLHDLGAHPVLEAVGEAGRGIDVDGRRVDPARELVRRVLRRRDDRLHGALVAHRGARGLHPGPFVGDEVGEVLEARRQGAVEGPRLQASDPQRAGG